MMSTIKSVILIGVLGLLAACSASPAKDSGTTNLGAKQLTMLVQKEGNVYNMVAPIVKGYTMSDPKMTKKMMMMRRKKILGWGTRLKRAGADIKPIFFELNNVDQGVDTPNAMLLKQETATYNMVAPIVKGYTMSDPKIAKKDMMMRRKKIVGWGMMLKSMGGEVDPIFAELM